VGGRGRGIAADGRRGADSRRWRSDVEPEVELMEVRPCGPPAAGAWSGFGNTGMDDGGGVEATSPACWLEGGGGGAAAPVGVATRTILLAAIVLPLTLASDGIFSLERERNPMLQSEL
jgi:hypothetical protein